MKFSGLAAALGPLGSGLLSMDSLGLCATLPPLLGLGASGQPTMDSTDVLTPDCWRFTLEPSTFGHRLTLSTADSPTSGHHC